MIRYRSRLNWKNPFSRFVFVLNTYIALASLNGIAAKCIPDNYIFDITTAIFFIGLAVLVWSQIILLSYTEYAESRHKKALTSPPEGQGQGFDDEGD